MNWLAQNGFELAAVVITLLSIWLATREHIGYYPTGLVALAMYTWLYYTAKLYAESLLQIICFALMLYGWYAWLYGGARHTQLPVTRTPRWGWVAGVASGVLASAATIWIQLTYTDNPNPYVDSSLFAWSLVAQWMTARKWLENWILWVLVNTVSVPLYYVRDLKLTAVLYVGLWILAVVGYRDWKRSMHGAHLSDGS
ncbi:MAG TPA: nicotinamide riboside transporter PnuC [Thermoanaerobaculia bacterium]|nr:nicotinamide riboside transporter PnuC [Thermoanaerobaculia bacterium]